MRPLPPPTSSLPPSTSSVRKLAGGHSLWALAWLGPNTQQIMGAFKPALENVIPIRGLRWQPNLFWLGTTAFVLFYAITEMGRVSEFLYFQF